MIWQKNYGGLEDDEFQSVKITSDGYYTLAGNTKSYGDLNNDFWFFKVNSSGDSITSSRLGNLNKAEMCYEFIEDSYNKLVFCGSYDTSFYNVGKNVSYILRTDLSGSFIDEIKIPGAFTPDDKFSAIADIGFRAQYFLSRKVIHPAFGIDVQPYIIDYAFVFIGATTYVSGDEDEAYDVITTKNKGYLMVGSTNGFDLVSEDVLLIKLDSALINAQIVVGIKDNKNYVVTNRIYYFENVIYFENQKHELLSFQLLNSIGKVVETGSTKDEFIKINPDLEKDIYIIRIIESDLKIKFIKQ